MITRIPKTPPVILPVPPTEERPLWSVVIPTYNCYNLLKQTLHSVLLQDPGPDVMQIDVVDDCSTDGDVEALVQEIGNGRIGFYRQPRNVGSLRNFETCLNRAKGKFIHLLHGDDLVLEGFYKEMEAMFVKFPQAGAAFSNYSSIDSNNKITLPGLPQMNVTGIFEDFLFQIAQRQLLQAAAMVVKREVYEHLGSFFAVHYGEDWEMWTRIAAHYPVAYSPKCLALYRGGQEHTTSITSNSLKTGQNIRDIKKVIEIVQEYLPREKRKELKRRAIKNYSRHYAKASSRIYQYDRQAAFVQANGALMMHRDIQTIYWVMKLYLKHFRKTITISN